MGDVPSFQTINSNYMAYSVNTPLDGQAIVSSSELEKIILKNKTKTVAYHCFYDMEKRDSFVEYKGLICPVFETIHLDFDDKDDGGSSAWRDVLSFAQQLEESKCDFQIYFSGNKGFHVAVHMDAFGIKAGNHKEVSHSVKNILLKLQKQLKTLDERIWNPNRKFRAYRSYHLDSGLYKIRLTDADLDWENLTISEIREIAKTQQNLKYKHPNSPECKIDWLCLNENEIVEIEKESKKQKKERQIVEVPKGQMLSDEDESLAYETFDGKKCIEKMMDCWLKQFNRHDISFIMINDMQKTGLSMDLALSRMNRWAKRMYDRDELRVAETLRMVNEAYTKENNYKYSCYDSIKKAYCSGKCKVYSHLDPKKRHEPIDLSERQKTENLAKENPLVGLSEGEIADKILSEMPEICKSNDEFFRWNTTHWERIGKEHFRDILDKAGDLVFKNKAGITKIKNLSSHIISKIPMAPENNCFFKSSPNKFNFSDVTIEVIVKTDGKIECIYKPHDKSDYLAYCAPFPFMDTSSLPRNGMFEKYLQGRADDIGNDNFRILKQMMGAALVPFVPRIFFIEGVSNSGKSTFALLVKRLLGDQNVSSVLPVIQGNGGDRFNWENGIGKIANIVLELPKGCELDVNTLKMVRDKSPVAIDRKGLQKVLATLPFLHIYCCNVMPPSFEGNSGALNNRMTMLSFQKAFKEDSGNFLEFADMLWHQDSGSILDFAKLGLADLIDSNFKYHETPKSQELVKDWQIITDNVSLYFSDLKENDWDSEQAKQMKSGVCKKYHGSLIYSDFKKWCEAVGKKCLGKHQFYKELQNKMKFKKHARAEGGVVFEINL